MKDSYNPYDGLEPDDLENLAEWNGLPLLGRKNIGTDNNHSGPPRPRNVLNSQNGPMIIHKLSDNTTLEHPYYSSDACSYCEAMK